MPSETEVISCPACRHLVRVPADWLGQTVQCPECKATFTAPTRDGDRLTDPQLLTAPPSGPAVARRRGKADVMLYLPAFGLMLVGFASAAINGWNSARYIANPAAAEQDVANILRNLRGDAKGPDGKTVEEEAAANAPKIRVLVPVFAAVGGVVFAGGLALAFRRYRRLAQVACVLAAVNVANGCCIPGAVFGLWGLLMLRSDEGRDHFG